MVKWRSWGREWARSGVVVCPKEAANALLSRPVPKSVHPGLHRVPPRRPISGVAEVHGEQEAHVAAGHLMFVSHVVPESPVTALSEPDDRLAKDTSKVEGPIAWVGR